MSKHAFTLVELLTIIASVAMLAVLVLPALAKSKDDGTRTVCANNLRQMGLASNMYAGDNSDYLAPPNWDGGFQGTAGWLYNASNGSIPNPNIPPYVKQPRTAYQGGLWFQYISNPKPYLCPVDIKSIFYTQRNDQLCSYVMNGSVCGFQNLHSSCKTSDAWNPACYLLWEPDENYSAYGNPGPNDFNDGANFPNTSEGIGRLHAVNGGEVLSVAGNIQFVTLQQFQFQAAYQGTPQQPKGLAWWNPFSASGR